MHTNIQTGHLTYCSNIHAGESWQDIFSNIKNYTVQVRDRMTSEAFGIGLRLSNQASIELLHGDQLPQFKAWLDDQNMYVGIINGFPYGGFHHQVVKDNVHRPDWLSKERLSYTKRLFDILQELLPEGMDGGVSTSPISYRFWHKDPENLEKVKKQASLHLLDLILYLHQIKEDTGKSLHLDLEPEPDGIIETTGEFVDFFNNYLIKDGTAHICRNQGCDIGIAEQIIRAHFQLCYDVCHFAVGFEKPDDALKKMLAEGIKIGRVQISAALSSGIVETTEVRSNTIGQLMQFDESTYLHQAVIRNEIGELKRYPDLKPALDDWPQVGKTELRTHFHVPVFTRTYGDLISTQGDILEVLQMWKESKFTNHLEVETYTWDVLPLDMRADMVSSIVRELTWVQERLEG